MKRLLLLLPFSVLLLTITPGPIAIAQNSEPENGEVVCLPDVYVIPPDDCLPAGPSVTLTALAKLGLTIPERPLPSSRPDPELSKLPYRYFHLEKDSVPVLSGPAGTETGQ